MQQAIRLTPFEEQVLQAIQECLKGRSSVTADHIVFQGSRMFSHSWGGRGRSASRVLHTTYPAINGALGRLVTKGLVERRNWEYMLFNGYHTGAWKLTPLGQKLMGMSEK